MNSIKKTSACTGLDVPVQLSEALEAIIESCDLIQERQPLYLQGDACEHIYAIQRGALKSVWEDGEKSSLVYFFYPGDFVGLECFSAGEYRTSLIAIEETSVCKISMEKLMKQPGMLALQMFFLGRMHQQIVGMQANAICRTSSANVRVAAHLLEVRKQTQRNSQDGIEFPLPMPRSEISNFLGLRKETLSRVLNKFQRSGWIRLAGGHVQLLNPKALGTAATPVLQAQRR